MTTFLHISLYFTKPFLIYDFEPDLFYFLLYKESILFFFNSVEHPLGALYVLKCVFSERGKTSNNRVPSWKIEFGMFTGIIFCFSVPMLSILFFGIPGGAHFGLPLAWRN
jgi:hypothetical protein